MQESWKIMEKIMEFDSTKPLGSLIVVKFRSIKRLLLIEVQDSR